LSGKRKIEDEIDDIQRMVSQSSDQQARDQEILSKKSEISKIDERLNKHLNKDFQKERVFEEEKDEKLSEIRKSLRQKAQECRKIDDKIDGITSSREKKLQDKKKELKQAKDIYSAIGKEYLTLKKNYKDSPTICYACKQHLPEDTLVKREEDYKKQTAEIEKKGKQAATKCRALEEQFNDISKESTIDSEEMLNLQQERKRLEEEVRTLKGKSLDIEKTTFKTPKNEDRKALEKEKNTLLDELKTLKNKPLNISESVKKYRKDIENKKAESQKITADISRFKPMQDIQSRIKDLNDKKAALIKQVNDIEKWISLIDDFNNVQADLLEKPINEHLKIGEFSLFEPLVSGGLAPSCTMKVDGVSYHSLNSTTKMNVGLSFINAISIKAGIKMPVWIDGAESYQGLINLETQFFSIEVLVDNVSEIQENIPDFNHKAFGNNMIVNGKDVGNILWVKD
jgi:DNA repair exonuclease SbcCD ATPase subunit